MRTCNVLYSFLTVFLKWVNNFSLWGKQLEKIVINLTLLALKEWHGAEGLHSAKPWKLKCNTSTCNTAACEIVKRWVDNTKMLINKMFACIMRCRFCLCIVKHIEGRRRQGQPTTLSVWISCCRRDKASGGGTRTCPTVCDYLPTNAPLLVEFDPHRQENSICRRYKNWAPFRR